VIKSWSREDKAISDSHIPTNVIEVRSFYGLASFCWTFVKYFNTLIVPFNEILNKNVSLHWKKKQGEAFANLKKHLTHASILTLPKFSKYFEKSVMLQM